MSSRPANRTAAPSNVKPAKPQAAAADVVTGGSSNFLMFNAMPSVLSSMIFHVVLFLILALLFVSIDDGRLVQEFVMATDSREEVEDVKEIDPQEIVPLEIKTVELEPTELAMVDSPLEVDTPDPSEFSDPESGAVDVPIHDPLGELVAPEIFNPSKTGWHAKQPFDGRSSPKGRLRQAIDNGGDPDTEEAVQRALKWLASRQSRDDGGWNFDHNAGNSVNPARCPNPGSADDVRNGATGLILLPFLGSGQTHKEGVYKAEVRAGLAYLIRKMKVEGGRGSWHEPGGSMYSHGICAIAMCEAYAMTHDRELLAPAQLALNYIVYAQDPVGGGWRYNPQQAGDTSAMGWQLMALKSGHMAYLKVPEGSVLGAAKFLDSVQTDSGARYGYATPGGGQSTTSVGLLSRMYLGWKHDNPAMQRGVAFLDKTGPSKSGNMYYNYYATQVCRHYEGEVWQRWNAEMKPWLLLKQSDMGVTAGSWYFPGGDHGADRGGRLYCTAMATMMLEVYYRHQPLYRQQAVDDEFAL